MSYLAITNTAGTAAIYGGTADGRYKTQFGAWAPGVNLNKTPGLDNNPYAAVSESMRLNVSGTSAAAAYGHLRDLTKYFHQADKWVRGESGTAVLLEYSPPGGTVSGTASPLRAAIRRTNAIALPTDTFDIVDTTSKIIGVQVDFERTVWLASAQTNASSATNAGEIASVTITPALDYPSPARVQIGNFAAGGTAQVHLSPGFLIYAPGTAYLQNIEWETLTSGAAGTAFSGTANTTARGGTVMVFQPTNTSINYLNLATLTIPDHCNKFFVVTSISSDTNAARTWIFFARLHQYAAGPSVEGWVNQKLVYYQTSMPIPGSQEQPKYVVFGPYQRPNSAYKKLMFGLYVSTAASGPRLEMDYMTIVGIEDETTGIIGHSNLNPANYMGTAATWRTFFDHAMLTYPDPIAGAELTSGGSAIVFDAMYSAPTVWVKGTAAAFVWRTSGTVDTSIRWWRLYTAGTVLTTPTYTAVISPAHPTPV